MAKGWQEPGGYPPMPIIDLPWACRSPAQRDKVRNFNMQFPVACYRASANSSPLKGGGWERVPDSPSPLSPPLKGGDDLDTLQQAAGWFIFHLIRSLDLWQVLRQRRIRSLSILTGISGTGHWHLNRPS